MNTESSREREEIISEFIQKCVSGSYYTDNESMRRIARKNNTPIEILQHLLEHPNEKVRELALLNYSDKKAIVALYKVNLAIKKKINGSLSFHDYFVPGHPDWIVHDYLYETGQVDKCFDESQFSKEEDAIRLCKPNPNPYQLLIIFMSWAGVGILLLLYIAVVC